MDFWPDLAFSVVLRILKNKKQAIAFRDALFKLHGKIEDLFPELQPETRLEHERKTER